MISSNNYLDLLNTTNYFFSSYNILKNFQSCFKKGYLFFDIYFGHYIVITGCILTGLLVKETNGFGDDADSEL